MKLSVTCEDIKNEVLEISMERDGSSIEVKLFRIYENLPKEPDYARPGDWFVQAEGGKPWFVCGGSYDYSTALGRAVKLIECHTRVKAQRASKEAQAA